ncbi:MAG TPA: EAL domain-containing protein [Jatrophihabitans sp.]|jgi:EAL domain-containing protein (putative c-di-GMP-specific phosphodiesterase class I)|nr:EAL domain-containing protein [Jatrophihabitans sp.]
MSARSVHVETPSAEALAASIEGLAIYLQPIIDVGTGALWAYEALARFGSGPVLAADAAIASAHRAGYGHALEAACLRAAFARRGELPEGVRLALNVSPAGLLSRHVRDMWETDLHGVIVEVTEHHLADNELALAEFARLRARGAAIAVDDVGSGYAGLVRLATLRPDYVKLDRTIVSGARESEALRAIVETLVAFSHRIEAKVVGEGVETLDDLAMLVQFDVDYGQGWAIGRPSSAVESIPSEVVAMCHQARAEMLQRHGAVAPAASSTHVMHAVTGALGRATEVAALHVATAQAAAELGVDGIAVSVLDEDGVLREITSTGDPIDTRAYAIADYPATRRVIDTGVPVEVHVNDPDADPAECALLSNMGHASLLMVPLAVGEQRIGVLEFLHRTHRRWPSTEIAHARGLSIHLGNALLRITA